jgi:hypothetical protein
MIKLTCAINSGDVMERVLPHGAAKCASVEVGTLPRRLAQDAANDFERFISDTGVGCGGTTLVALMGLSGE